MMNETQEKTDHEMMQAASLEKNADVLSDATTPLESLGPSLSAPLADAPSESPTSYKESWEALLHVSLGDRGASVDGGASLDVEDDSAAAIAFTLDKVAVTDMLMAATAQVGEHLTANVSDEFDNDAPMAEAAQGNEQTPVTTSEKTTIGTPMAVAAQEGEQTTVSGQGKSLVDCMPWNLLPSVGQQICRLRADGVQYLHKHPAGGCSSSSGAELRQPGLSRAEQRRDGPARLVGSNARCCSSCS